MKTNTTYFTSDWHLGHANVIKFDNRPFTSVEEMDETIINNCNNLVGSDDTLYYLGDLTFHRDKKRTKELIYKLKCQNIHYILGNHDKQIWDFRDRFLSVEKYSQPTVEGQSIFLCHYAMSVWNKSHHGAWHLYGHSHHSFPDRPDSLSFDVGCNGWDYAPISFEQVKAKMATKTFKPIDHHR